MTSFIINAHTTRKVPDAWKQDPTCPFCRIIQGDLSAFRVFEDDKVIAILDILPLRLGHTLVIPKAHYQRLSDLPTDFAGATGVAVSKISRALTEALNNTGLNVVCNQEYAQAVPHVHFHIVPAPVFGSTAQAPVDPSTPFTWKEMHQKEFESREELDEVEAEVLVKKILARL